ncbi:hypothetical protein PCANC_27624 [Puccinia coronata f. sp. avenae]|uniref:Uncharacterized protein n=1 Tax=Puccinia coronata f. sp. avenae TaxID=200324 RepID=A0A2N5RVN0_9BASI|nr:hypothetical protein PCANC_27624 [Puccinia coronata f. sp. avenae]
MSLVATPRQRPLANYPKSSSPGCPPSPPPPVFSLTSAFFESPFSHTPPSRAPPQPDTAPSSLLPALSTSPSGSQLQTLTFDAAGNKPAMHDDNNDGDHHHHHHHHHHDALDWRVSSREWTPLSQRSSLAARQQTPAQTEDRLDRLLADMDALASPLLQCSSNIPPLDSPQLGSLSECWELHSLETRFHPFHNTTTNHPLRPCLKSRSTSVSSASSDTRSSSSDSNSTHNSQHFELTPSFQLLHHPALELQDDRTVRVRFDDDPVEEFLTWSRESYDRKGPMPITKLNLREVIELKLIKEELGISPTPAMPALSPSCSSSSSNSSTSSSPLPPPFVGPHIPSASQ